MPRARTPADVPPAESGRAPGMPWTMTSLGDVHTTAGNPW